MANQQQSLPRGSRGRGCDGPSRRQRLSPLEHGEASMEASHGCNGQNSSLSVDKNG